MVNYKNGKIYKLVAGDYVYIGSTTQKLCVRLAGHKIKNYNTTARILFESGYDVKIILIEDFPCENKDELTAREYYHIQNNECVNRTKRSLKTMTDDELINVRREKYKKNAEKNKALKKLIKERNEKLTQRWIQEEKEEKETINEIV
jgi:hypothetical protein